MGGAYSVLSGNSAALIRGLLKCISESCIQKSPCVSEGCIKIKINLHFYFYTSLLYLKLMKSVTFFFENLNQNDLLGC